MKGEIMFNNGRTIVISHYCVFTETLPRLIHRSFRFVAGAVFVPPRWIRGNHVRQRLGFTAYKWSHSFEWYCNVHSWLFLHTLDFAYFTVHSFCKTYLTFYWFEWHRMLYSKVLMYIDCLYAKVKFPCRQNSSKKLMLMQCTTINDAKKLIIFII